MPQMPQMPEMPQVSAPALGAKSEFYAPGSSSFYGPSSSSSAKQSSSSSQNTQTQGAQTQSAQTQDEQTQSAPSSSTAATESEAALSQIQQTLSAADISSVAATGLFSSISSLLGSSDSSLQTLPLSSTAQTDSILLKRILSELTELKARLDKNESAPQTKPEAPKSKILRFIINGLDVLPLCRAVYFSTQEHDGSFLLTGDVKSLSDSSRQETFHLLFRAQGTKESATVYSVTPAVYCAQDTVPTLAALSQKETLPASRTGNLVTLRQTESDFSIDLLISLGN